MQIKYVGPKAIISHTGISFDNNKEDKYVYLHIVYQLYQALNHDYIEDKEYVYDALNKRVDNETLIDEAHKLCSNLEEKIEASVNKITQEIDLMIERAQTKTTLDQESKDVLEKNLKMMKSYRIQRRINKTIYYCLVEALAELCKRDHIDYIIAPMFQKFQHVFHSVQGVLNRQKHPVNSEIEIYEEEGKLLAKLDIKNQ